VLDTPGGAANVFTREAAQQLCALLDEVRYPAVRAVVLRSGKPRSFVNGVGLLMAGTLKSPDEAIRMTAPVRAAYHALRDCPAPTIAAIEGNCYGCGVELVAQCRYRVAADTFDTHFYMTELAEYLFVPTFGGTQELPGLLGFEKASEFVMWGPRWSARQAVTEGLIDRCFAAEAFQRELEGFVAEVAGDGSTAGSGRRRRIVSSPEGALRVSAGLRGRIERLPPAYRTVYGSCLDLMASAAVDPQPEQAAYLREAEVAARSILDAPCRSAWPFFFVRQIAQALATGGTPRPGAREFAFTALDEHVAVLAAELASRCLPALRAPPAPGRETFRLRRYEPALPSDGVPVDRLVVVSTASTAAAFAADSRPSVVTAHLPFRASRIDVAEIGSPAGEPSATARALGCALTDAGFTVIQTTPKAGFVLDRLLTAWLTPLVVYLASGGAPIDLACSLRTFGFTRLPGDWIGALDARALAELVRTRLPELPDVDAHLASLPAASSPDGSFDPALMSAVVISLGAFAARAVRDRCVAHVAYIDLAARDVIDFPLLHTSLCRHVTVARIRELLQSRPAFDHLVDGDDVALLEEFVANGRDYYAVPHS
jgi:enoyl-CoA hydratase/carnithine racemase